MTDAFQQIALKQVEKNQPIVMKKQKNKVSKPVMANSLSPLVDDYESELFIRFDVPDESDPIVFHIKTLDPGVLFLETGVPVYIKSTESDDEENNNKNNIANIPINKISPKQRQEILKDEVEHKYRILAQNILSPELSMGDETGKAPVQELPIEVMTYLYESVMQAVQDGEELIDAFHEKSQQNEAQDSLFMIYEMASTFSIRPYQLLFPTISNPHIQLAIDMIVFQIGYKKEKEEEYEKLKIQAGIAGMKRAIG